MSFYQWFLVVVSLSLSIGEINGKSNAETVKFPPLVNDDIIKAARGKPVSRIPVWVSRQTGTYLPAYRELRKRFSFSTICHTPKLATNATLLPFELFDLDAAFIFQDLLAVPEALGLQVAMIPVLGPRVLDPIVNVSNLDRLDFRVNVSSALKYVHDAITLTRIQLAGRAPLIGFVGGPWTLMSFIVEGDLTRTQSKAKKWLYTEPEASSRLLDLLTQIAIDHLVQQALAGAQLLQVVESGVASLTPTLFKENILPRLELISTNVKSILIEKYQFEAKDLPPMTLSATSNYYALSRLVDAGYDVLDLDFTINPKDARTATANDITLQGNLDPATLYASDAELRVAIDEMLKGFGKRRYIANLGDMAYADTNPDKVKLFVDYVHKRSASIQ